jgi:ligand-binding sensor domain-containing protein/serine phosphatase RsbU (regulator of sigma subunit)
LINRAIIFFAVLLLFVNSIIAQQLRFKHITSEDGLSTNHVSSIIQDDKGFMWFGTQDGLNKYDGYQVQIYKNDPTNRNTLTSSEVTCLKQIKSNLILVGTLGGINFFNPVTGSFSTVDDQHLNTKITAIQPYDSDNVLVGTEDGLYILNLIKRSVKPLTSPDKLSVTAIHVMNGIAYAGTATKGVWTINGSRIEKVNFSNPDFREFKKEQLQTVTDIKSYGEKLYIGTIEYGVFKVDASTGEVESRISMRGAGCNHILSLEIKENKMYCSTTCGLVLYKFISEEKMEYTKTEDSYSLNSILATCSYIDSENNIWVGTNLGGVNVAFAQALKFSNPNLKYESAGFKNIFSFLEERSGLVWLGCVKRLVQMNLLTGKFTDYSRLLESNTALCIAQESEDVFWIGTWGNGIIRFDRATGKMQKYLSKDFGSTVLCLKIHENYIYAGTVGDGLFRININTSEVTNFNTNDGLPNQSINTIFRDSKGAVWMGTYDGGLVKLSDFAVDKKLPIIEKFKNEGKPNQLASNIVLGINEDKAGNIWVATSNGLSKLRADQKSFYNFYEKDGLYNTYLYSILKDSVDNFWMSSNGGLIRFDPNVPEKDITFKNYGVKDGLQNKEYNMGAAFSGKSGYLYFGGGNGFDVFRPTAIKNNLHPPQVYIVSYKRGGSDVKTDSLITFKKNLNLSWRENYFQFEVVALDYTDPSKNKFKYKLEGYDNDWSAPTNVRYVSYTELPGGDYVFKVKAANNDGIWNEVPYEIKIRVVPPFWRTKWFYVILLLLSIAAIYGFTQYRTQAIKKENKILENKVAERTKELEEKNRDITSSIEYAKRIQEAILPSKGLIFSRFTKAFILYRPKDIVSGDFYWYGEKNGYKIFAIVDCTGHGVPGAFMSMIGHNLIHQIVQEKGIVDPGAILNNLHKGVQEALRQGENEINTNDGMDISLMAVNDSERVIRWAGANRPLILIDARGSLTKYDGNKFPVGGVQLDVNRFFTTHTIKCESGTMAYMFTDGYADQFGGEKGKKFMVKRFYNLLLSIHEKPTEEQKIILEDNLERWRQNQEQVDDVLVAGVAI